MALTHRCTVAARFLSAEEPEMPYATAQAKRTVGTAVATENTNGNE